MNKTITCNQKKHDYQRDAYIYNCIASIINASESIVFLMVTSRLFGDATAGIVTIAFNIANLMSNVGKFGVRNFQVTDAKSRYSFRDYRNVRFITSLAMTLATAAYLFGGYKYNHYTGTKIAVIICITAIYISESIEDVYWGNYQRNNRLDIGAKIFSIRWTFVMLTFIAASFLSRDVVIAVSLSAICSWILMISLICHVNKKESFVETSSSDSKKLSLIKECFPLAAGSFLYLYITNASRYAMDGLLPDSSVAIYGYLSMPVFIVGLVSAIIYQPALVAMAEEWRENDIQSLQSHIRKQCLYILLLTFLCLIGAYFLGIPVLSLLFDVDLSAYRPELLILIAGSGILAIGNFFGAIITIMRKQKLMLLSYVVVALLSLPITRVCIQLYGLFGAAIITVCGISSFTMIFVVIVMVEFRRKYISKS